MEKVASTEERQIASKRWSDIEKKGRVLVAGIAMFLGAVTLSNCSSGSSINKESLAHTPIIDSSCNNQNQINVKYPGNPDEIIPQKSNGQEISEVTNDDEAATYIKGLFSKKGPMGKYYDPAVIATLWTLMGYPATTNGYQTEDSILAIFSSSFDQMTTNNKGFNNLSANKFCKSTKSIMSSTNFSFEDVAIAKGTLITQIEAVTKNGKIYNIDLKSFNAKDNISGIVFKIQNKSALNGFITVVIDNQGNIWVTGIQPTSGGSSSNSQSKSSNQSQKSSGGGGVTGNGKVSENLSGNSVGNSSGGTGNGNIGNSNESNPGNGSTPSGGNTTTTTEAPTTTTTESPTPTTTTTSPVQKKPDPNQGGCTDPFDPTCQSGS